MAKYLRGCRKNERDVVPGSQNSHPYMQASCQKLSQSEAGTVCPPNWPPWPSYKPFHLMTFFPLAVPNVNVKSKAPLSASAYTGASVGTLHKNDVLRTPGCSVALKTGLTS